MGKTGTGIRPFLSLGLMGIRSLDLDWSLQKGKKCQKWDWEKYCVTMTSRDTLLIVPRVDWKHQKMSQACTFFVPILSIFIQN